MIDESIRLALTKKHGDLNFNGLLALMEASGANFKVNKLRGGVLGIATIYDIYLDLGKIDSYNEKILFFVILHELAHSKRFKKLGKKFIIKMLSHEEFDAFFEFIVGEEKLADRYGCYAFYALNNKSYPRTMTQELDNKHKQEQYKRTASYLFGQIQNNEEKYNALLETYLV